MGLFFANLQLLSAPVKLLLGADYSGNAKREEQLVVKLTQLASKN